MCTENSGCRPFKSQTKQPEPEEDKNGNDNKNNKEIDTMNFEGIDEY